MLGCLQKSNKIFCIHKTKFDNDSEVSYSYRTQQDESRKRKCSRAVKVWARRFQADSHGLNLQPTTKKRRGKIMRDNFEKVTDIKKCSISAETCTLTNGWITWILRAKFDTQETLIQNLKRQQKKQLKRMIQMNLISSQKKQCSIFILNQRV